MNIFERINNLNISETCKQDIMSLVEDYIDSTGHVQKTLNLGVDNGLDGRDIQAEQQKKKERAEKAAATRKKNKQIEFNNRPIFKALEYDPSKNEENK